MISNNYYKLMIHYSGYQVFQISDLLLHSSSESETSSKPCFIKSWPGGGVWWREQGGSHHRVVCLWKVYREQWPGKDVCKKVTRSHIRSCVAKLPQNRIVVSRTCWIRCGHWHTSPSAWKITSDAQIQLLTCGFGFRTVTNLALLKRYRAKAYVINS